MLDRTHPDVIRALRKAGARRAYETEAQALARLTPRERELIRLFNAVRVDAIGGRAWREARMEGFHAPAVCQVTGITYRQLDYWDRSGLVSPSVTAAKGSGSARLYSSEDIAQLQTIHELLLAGVSLQAIRKAVAEDFYAGIGALVARIHRAGTRWLA